MRSRSKLRRSAAEAHPSWCTCDACTAPPAPVPTPAAWPELQRRIGELEQLLEASERESAELRRRGEARLDAYAVVRAEAARLVETLGRANDRASVAADESTHLRGELAGARATVERLRAELGDAAERLGVVTNERDQLAARLRTDAQHGRILPAAAPPPVAEPAPAPPTRHAGGRPPGRRENSVGARILALAARPGGVTRAELPELLGAAAGTVDATIRRLGAALRREGAVGERRYVAASTPPAPVEVPAPPPPLSAPAPQPRAVGVRAAPEPPPKPWRPEVSAPRPSAMPGRALVALPIAKLTGPGDAFRCPVFSATITAKTCTDRQTLAEAHTTGRGTVAVQLRIDANRFSRCRGCQHGRAVVDRLASVPEAAE